eukprot:420215_1
MEQSYNPFGDPLTPLILMFVAFSALVVGRLTCRCARFFKIWQIPRDQKEPSLSAESETSEFDLMENIRSDAVRQMFLKMNRPWLLQHIDKVLTP